MYLIFLLITVMAVSLIALVGFKRWAISYGWVDTPSGRKNHAGQVPLIGGVSVFSSLLSIYFFDSQLIHFQNTYFLIAGIVVAIGFIDDKYNLSAISRLTLLLVVAFWLVSIEGIVLSDLGDLFGFGEVLLGQYSALIFSVVAIVGCVTCFNMIDGIDGLLGCVSASIFISLSVLLYFSKHTGEAIFSLAFVAALIPYIVFNLSYRISSHRKVFMGDSGSFLVGLTVVWMFIIATQPSVTPYIQDKTMNPVTALWIIAIPLMDMVCVMIKRVMKKSSPLKADRTHLHHLLLARGLSARKTLIVISLMSLLISALGITADVLSVNENLMFLAFIGLFIVYTAVNLQLEKALKQTLCTSVA